jgi:hypothetical protein
MSELRPCEGGRIGRLGYGASMSAQPSVAATGVKCGRSPLHRAAALHFSNPESLSGLSILQVSRYHYRIVIIGKINFCGARQSQISAVITP